MIPPIQIESKERTWRSMDAFEADLAASGPRAECPVTHLFTPGLYVRETLLPAGTVLTSMEHKREHPFVILRGKIEVMSAYEDCVVYEAPFKGVTKPGTRRVLRAIEDTVWVTFHVTESTDLDQIAIEMLEPHNNPLLADGDKDQWRIENPTPHLS